MTSGDGSIRDREFFVGSCGRPHAVGNGRVGFAHQTTICGGGLSPPYEDSRPFMDSSLWAFLLLAIGMALLVAEVFIPSGGVITILAALSLVGALICAGNAWWSSNPGYFWGFVTSMVVLLPLIVAAAFYVWPSTPLGRRAILEAPAPHEVASFVEQEERYGQMVGKVGETLTVLNPAGIVRIDGHRVHCQSEGVILEAGARVRVISAKGNRVIVRRGASDIASASEGTAAPPGTAQPLDFDLT
jgi:membrane-bound serine protease (ClpP class)